MICTVEAGPRKAKRSRSWQEMRLVTAEAHGSTTPIYGATFGNVDDIGQRWGHCARQEQIDYPRALANDLPIGSGLI